MFNIGVLWFSGLFFWIQQHFLFRQASQIWDVYGILFRSYDATIMVVMYVTYLYTQNCSCLKSKNVKIIIFYRRWFPNWRKIKYSVISRIPIFYNSKQICWYNRACKLPCKNPYIIAKIRVRVCEIEWTITTDKLAGLLLREYASIKSWIGEG